MDKIDDILSRGVSNLIPSHNEIKKALSERKLNIYLGIDPTATKIHLGHAVPLRKLQKLAELGHDVTFLIGDFTALVGDTSDKDSERPILTPEEIEANFKTYRQQASKILSFEKIKIRKNSEWLSKLTYAELIRIKQQFSLNDFISRELIRERLKENKIVRLDETEYPIMQGYDSYFMDTDLQIGSADQTFNMQAGRTLQRKLRNKDSYILVTDYLPGTDGRKMSKSWGNAIWLDDAPQDMYAKVMAINDDVILQFFVLATNVPLSEIEHIEDHLNAGKNPLEIKKELAKAIVSELYSQEQAKAAEERFEKTVQKKELPEDVPTFEMKPDEHLVVTDLLVRAGLAASKSDAKRLVDQGAVEVDSDLVDSPFEEIVPEDNMLIKAGKRNYVRIKTSNG